jgi:UDP-N-acetylmuramoylalanine--D-glutamate ligase
MIKSGVPLVSAFEVIAGGVDKGGSYAPLLTEFAPRARGLVLLGQAAEVIDRAAREHAGGMPPYPIEAAADMPEAVRRARSLARAGDAVVLSPACSSYDMFSDYRARGDAFRDAARACGATAPARADQSGEDVSS